MLTKTLARLKQHPKAFWFVFWGELAERASFYGMRTLLALYLIDVLHFDQGRSGQTVQFFMATCFVLPLLGGWIADRYLGKFKTILYFSFPYILGHLILGQFQSPFWMFVALALLAMGSGSINPNTSTLMGLIYEKEDKKFLLSEAFSYFYAAINIGAAATSLALPPLRDKYGYGFALMSPTILMIVAVVIFAYGKKYYPHEDVRKAPPKTVAQRKEERAILARVAGIFTLLIGFWLVYDQSASTWIFLARDHMDLTLRPFNVVLAPDQVQGFNPVFIILLTPVFNGLWTSMREKSGVSVPATHKIMLGFILAFICMAAMSVAGFLSVHGKVSVWFSVIATFVITMAELCVSVVGLEFAYSVASERTKSTVTAAFLLTIFIGDFLGGVMAGFYDKMAPGAYFGIQAALLAVLTVLFYFAGKKFDRETSSQVSASSH